MFESSFSSVVDCKLTEVLLNEQPALGENTEEILSDILGYTGTTLWPSRRRRRLCEGFTGFGYPVAADLRRSHLKDSSMETSLTGSNLTDSDLAFVVSAAAPDGSDVEHLKHLVRNDPDFRHAIVADDRVFHQIMRKEDIFLSVTPALYFEVLLRRVQKHLATAKYTVEQSGREAVPVFDTPEVVDFLARPQVLEYLAQMLASFVRIESYVTRVRVARGIRRRVRFSDMDVDSLVRLCAAADEPQRFRYYKRIADVCLFISGLFPSYSRTTTRNDRPTIKRRARRTSEDYEAEGRRFYRLAERHHAAQPLELSSVLGLLAQHFASARKPLNFIAAHYLHSSKDELFGLSG